MKFWLRRELKCKNIVKQEVTIPAYTTLETLDNFIIYNRLPLCGIDSQMARDNFIWADNDDLVARLAAESTIVLRPRQRFWEEKVPEYDDNGNIIGYKVIQREARFSPVESSFIRKQFPQLLEEGPVIQFNNYFYHGSTIKELEQLAQYLDNSNS